MKELRRRRLHLLGQEAEEEVSRRPGRLRCRLLEGASSGLVMLITYVWHLYTLSNVLYL